MENHVADGLLEGCRAGRLEVRNRFGDVFVVGLKASVDIDNGNGRVEVRDSRNSLKIEDSFGSRFRARSATPLRADSRR